MASPTSSNKKLQKITEQLKAINITVAKILFTEAGRQDARAPGSRKEGEETGHNCSMFRTNATCTAGNNCKWSSTTETTGEYCKPKEREEQKPQETGVLKEPKPLLDLHGTELIKLNVTERKAK